MDVINCIIQFFSQKVACYLQLYRYTKLAIMYILIIKIHNNNMFNNERNKNITNYFIITLYVPKCNLY